MTREQYLNILMLLNVMEALMQAHKTPFPPYLIGSLDEAVKILREEILK